MLAAFFDHGMMQNLIASAIFWILDIVLIVTLLPAILSFREKRKWRPMQNLIAQNVWQLFEELLEDLGSTTADSLVDLEGKLKIRRDMFNARLNLLTPSIDSELSKWLSDIITCLDRLEHNYSSITKKLWLSLDTPLNPILAEGLLRGINSIIHDGVPKQFRELDNLLSSAAFKYNILMKIRRDEIVEYSAVVESASRRLSDSFTAFADPDFYEAARSLILGDVN